MNGSPSTRNRRTGLMTKTTGDPKPTGIWDGSDGRMYPHLLPTDDFISQFEHHILETVANSNQIQQEAEDENDKRNMPCKNNLDWNCATICLHIVHNTF